MDDVLKCTSRRRGRNPAGYRRPHPLQYCQEAAGLRFPDSARQWLLRFGPVLKRDFYERPTVEVARDLLGKLLVHGPTAGIIVETEAYLGGDDLAAHSARGVTDRTRVIFGPPGHAYVYFIYGMYECLNLVAEPEGKPGCVLIRALEPVVGLELMRQRRPAARKPEDLASGPGKLTLAMAITRAQNGADVTRGSLVVREPAERSGIEIQATPRIGITKCAEWPLRFFVRGNRFVSAGQRGLPGPNIS